MAPVQLAEHRMHRVEAGRVVVHAECRREVAEQPGRAGPPGCGVDSSDLDGRDLDGRDLDSNGLDGFRPGQGDPESAGAVWGQRGAPHAAVRSYAEGRVTRAAPVHGQRAHEV